MAKIITYSLLGDEPTSDGYYRAVSTLVDKWLPDAIRTVADIIAGFRQYRTNLGHADRSDAEYLFEMLVIGVELREHGGEAEHWPCWAQWSMEAALYLSSHFAKLESAGKKVRGWVGSAARMSAKCSQTRRMDLGRLAAWMRANGLGSRAERFSEWCGYLTPAISASTQQAIVRMVALADDFDAVSRRVLSPYTQGVDIFRAAAMRQLAHRYDAEMVMRTPLEYHLGMVGTEILNRVNRPSFQSARRRVVILPPCMRAHRDDACKAVKTELGAKCQACTPGCHVHQITMLGEKRGFEVVMIPDEMRHIGDAAARSVGGLGLVGVSCALTNWSGGWDAEKLGVPAQGVLLDYVGCSYHWDAIGIETNANMRQVEAIAAQQPIVPDMKAV